jgi:hypothetical protein
MRDAIPALVLVILGFFLFPAATHACSWVLVIEESDSRVLIIGEIKGHTIESFDQRQVFGVVVEPIHEYRAVPQQVGKEYRLFPHGVGADCSSQYFVANDRLKKHFKPGQLVTVIGYESTQSIPGNLSLGFGDGMEIVPDECTASDIASYELTYPVQTKICGSELFHSYKEIARLAKASEAEAREILTRLSQASIYAEFESLVEKYISSDADRIALLELRYADAIAVGCAVEPEYDFNYDEGYIDRRIKRSRWFEYCTRERQKAAKDGG